MLLLPSENRRRRSKTDGSAIDIARVSKIWSSTPGYYTWSREADRVREISPRSEPEPEPTKIFYPPPPRKSNSFSESYVDPEDKYPLPEKMKKKRKKTPKPIKKPTPEPIFEPVYVPTKTYVPPLVAKKKPPVKTKKSKNKDQLIRQQRDQRYKAQKLEQAKRSQIPVSNLRKVQSEINLKSIPKEALMKKSFDSLEAYLNSNIVPFTQIG
ncbi:hypothetical protein B9Z55_026693 [Caenorhabditis nigoni]|uniref:Uncharacterized protein n=1 Tax=Caenorhabditis nigoni TaxID=1611254 RepID=A0A2G5T4K0_9PELO|nr:hypothetical protein B9Z55_026693 [Caenorhabditis nigoni]